MLEKYDVFYTVSSFGDKPMHTTCIADEVTQASETNFEAMIAIRHSVRPENVSVSWYEFIGEVK